MHHQNVSKFRGSEMSFPAFCIGNFHQINSKKNVTIICLFMVFYISSNVDNVHCLRNKG